MFTLQNDPPRHRPAQFANEPAIQRKLLSGLDCLPGQQDLFAADGSEPAGQEPASYQPSRVQEQVQQQTRPQSRKLPARKMRRGQMVQAIAHRTPVGYSWELVNAVTGWTCAYGSKSHIRWLLCRG